MMLPEITQIAISPADVAVVETPKPLGQSFVFDFTAGDFLVKDGKVMPASEEAALKVWVEKILRTEKHRYKVYEGQDYGAGIEDLIGYQYPREFTEAELQREISEALTRHPQIAGISNLQIENEGAKTIVRFQLNLLNGQPLNQEVAF